jgi:PKD repeat protein
VRTIKNTLKLALLSACLLVLASCGSGGGNGVKSNSAAPNTPVISSSASVASTGQTISFSSSSSTIKNLPLVYSWDFGDGAKETGAATSHIYTTTGAYTVTLTVTDSIGQFTVTTASILVYEPPTTPVIFQSASVADTGQAITFTGTATDPNNLALTYAWNFGDGKTNTGSSIGHTYTAAGNYTVTLTVSNGVGLSSAATTSIRIYASPGAPTISSSPGIANANQSVTFTGSVADPDGRLTSYVWNFGDGGTGTGTSASHTYTADGTYSVTFTVTDIAGVSASATYSQYIGLPTDNHFIADCSGTNCGASSPTSYTGSGTGVWRYNNTTGTDATIGINIGGVSAGKTVTMLFSNGSLAAATSPATGVLATPEALLPRSASPTAPANVAEDHSEQDSNHLKLLVENFKLSSNLRAPTTGTKSAARSTGTAPPPLPTPAVGDTRSWKEFAFDNKTYATTAKAVCAVPNGRNVVIWVDGSYGSKVFNSDITAFANAYCGATGGYAKLTALMGDAWGTVPAIDSTSLISDTPTKQDINIVIVAATANYGGYFWAMNNVLITAGANYVNSNEALVFFINSTNLQSGVNYYISALMHESTHMINFYQRSELRATRHDTWLEETSAMMSEDIVTPSVLAGYNTIVSSRVPGYVNTGGAVSYVNWPELASKNYALGGSFGAYLNRRYGITIFEQLITDCSTTSYTCLDTLIKNHGGPGFVIDFARFGASIFAGLPAAGMPAAYAYPALSDGGYSLAAINVPTNAPSTATLLSSGFTAATHTYKKNTVAFGQTSYVRTGVVVPAKTTLIVVVK